MFQSGKMTPTEDSRLCSRLQLQIATSASSSGFQAGDCSPSLQLQIPSLIFKFAIRDSSSKFQLARGSKFQIPRFRFQILDFVIQ